MDSTLIARYQPGGDIYASLQSQYGTASADAIAQAALSGDETQVNAALTQAKFGAPLDASTASNFYTQVTTNPLAAPLASLNTGLANTLMAFLKSPAVLLVGGLALFVWLGGLDWIKGSLKK